MLLEAAIATALMQGADMNCSTGLSTIARFTKLSQEAAGSPVKTIQRYQPPAGATAYGMPLAGVSVEAESARDPRQSLIHIRYQFAKSFEEVSESAGRVVGAPCAPVPNAARCDLPSIERLLAGTYKVHVIRRATGSEVLCTQMPDEDHGY